MTPFAEAVQAAPPSISAYGPARSTIEGSPLSAEELRKIDAHWRACKYLALGMIYLQGNPLPRRLGHSAHTHCPSMGTAPMWARTLDQDNIRLLASHDLWRVNVAM